MRTCMPPPKPCALSRKNRSEWPRLGTGNSASAFALSCAAPQAVSREHAMMMLSPWAVAAICALTLVAVI